MQIAEGELKSGITPVTYCPFLDFNDNAQLAKFGLHNGGAQDANLLNEKWEGLALLPVQGNNTLGAANEYYLLAVSDNDFITQDGVMGGGLLPYKDSSGYNVDNQLLMFRVTLPEGSKPFAG